MNRYSANNLIEVADDIEVEMRRIDRLSADLASVMDELGRHPDLSRWIHESIALKLHNFYTGCERIFQIVATELNGGLPSGTDWHTRLLDRMSQQRDRRIPVVEPATAQMLQPYLGFRHVVRNIYGFELDAGRLMELARALPPAHAAFKNYAQRFVNWLRQLAEAP